MEETIILECDETGRFIMQDEFENSESTTTITKKCFSTPDKNGPRFERLFADMREGDILEFTFKNIRICSQCGKQLDSDK